MKPAAGIGTRATVASGLQAPPFPVPTGAPSGPWPFPRPPGRRRREEGPWVTPASRLAPAEPLPAAHPSLLPAPWLMFCRPVACCRPPRSLAAGTSIALQVVAGHFALLKSTPEWHLYEPPVPHCHSWSEIHRTDAGMKPVPLPAGYCPETPRLVRTVSCFGDSWALWSSMIARSPQWRYVTHVRLRRELVTVQQKGSCRAEARPGEASSQQDSGSHSCN